MVQYMLVAATAMLKDRKGISALEYAVLAAGVIGALAIAATTLGNGIEAAFTAVVAKLAANT